MNKRILLIATAVMTTLLALVALWQFREVALYVLISLVLAATFRPITRSESRRSLRTRSLLSLQYVVTIVVVVTLLFIVGSFLIGDFEQLTEAFARQSNWAIPEWMQGSMFQTTLERWLPTPDRLFAALTAQRQLVVDAILGITQGIGGFISALLIILFLSVYWSINQNHFERLWLSLLPADVRKPARHIWRTIEHDIGAYTRSEILQSILAIILLGIGYWLLGSPYPTLLAVTGALAWLVPVVGGILAIIMPLLLGLLTSVQLSMITVLYTLAVLMAIQIWVEPRLFRLKWDNPVLTFVLMLAMADPFGLVGIIAAPPLSAICQILWRFLVSDKMAVPDTTPQVVDVREHYARLQIAIEDMEGTPPPIIVSSMERLADLIEKARPIVKDLVPAKADGFHPSQPIAEEKIKSQSGT